MRAPVSIFSGWHRRSVYRGGERLIVIEDVGAVEWFEDVGTEVGGGGLPLRDPS